MKKNIIISCLVLIVLASTILVGARNYHDKIVKDNIIIAREKVKAANINHELSLLNEAKELLENIDGEEKEEILKDIKKIEEDIAKERILNKYLMKINKLDSDYTIEDTKLLKEEINDIKYKDVKEELLNKLDNIGKETKDDINKETKDDRNEDKKTNDEVEIVNTYIGKISAYNPYCEKCTNTVSSGKVKFGEEYYSDETYGDVYIISGDSTLPFGTIVKIKNLSYFDEDVYAIVLDRKSDVGIGKNSLFSLLFASDDEVNKFGMENDITCEVLRLGY